MGVVSNQSVFRFFKPINLTKCTKEDIKLYYNTSFEAYEGLFSSIKEESSYYLCPDRLRLPLIFYYAHTAAVFVNKLVLADIIKPNERVNRDIDEMFETGVDEMSWDSIEHFRMGGKFVWPTLEECKTYRVKCRELVNEIIDRTELVLPITPQSPWWVILMGIEHENIHFETSSVLIRQYPVNMVEKPNGWNYAPLVETNCVALKNRMIKLGETTVRLGKPYEFPSYGWDNEYGSLDLKLTPFEATEFKVTNEEFLEFVLKGGYEDKRLWSDEGWEWRSFKNVKHPKFWVCPRGCLSSCGSSLSGCSHCEGQFTELEANEFELNQKACDLVGKGPDEDFKPHYFGYKLRLMFDVVAMPRNWPVEVNYHEAKAYCNWKGNDFRVLSEAEHNAIRSSSCVDPDLKPEINTNLVFGSSTPVDMYAPNEKGFYDVFGNVWEWTEDHFNGLPGSYTDYLYDDFSTPCYDGRHNLIMGSSWASMGDVASPFARFMFRRHFFQHCGFRVARSLPVAPNKKMNPQIKYVIDRIYILGSLGEETVNSSMLDPRRYELNYYSTMNDEYFYDSNLHLDFEKTEALYQFGEVESRWFQPFMKSIDGILNDMKINRDTVVHLGTSMGRVSFELAKSFNQVYALDYCSKYLEMALRLQSEGKISINLTNQSINYNIENNSNSSNVLIKQLTWIPNEVKASDFVLFTMIDRVKNPLSWLRRFKEVVKPNGIAVIYTKESKFDMKFLCHALKEFELLEDSSIVIGDSLSVWKMKENYAKTSL